MLDGSRKQFQLGLLYFFAGLATLGVTPFCVLRFLQGDYLKFTVDLVILVAAVGSAVYAWLTRKVFYPCVIAAVLYTASTIGVVYLNGPFFMFWLFPALAANFFLLSPRLAAITNLLLWAATIPVALTLDDHVAAAGILVSLLFAGSMTYVFAWLADKQHLMLETVATQDALTQLGNRRPMDDEMQRCINDFKRTQSAASAIVLDLDNFKTINDRYGHRVGDELLVNIARLLSARIRKTDHIFRFGGEEFVVIARNTSLSSAHLLAEQLRADISARISSPGGAVSASFGCAELKQGEEAGRWLERADQAMYRAKEEGRNKVVLAE